MIFDRHPYMRMSMHVPKEAQYNPVKPSVADLVDTLIDKINKQEDLHTINTEKLVHLINVCETEYFNRMGATIDD